MGFEEDVLEMCKKVPKGKVTTYKEIAIALDCPLAARAVGNALNKNPLPVKIPCHRVVSFNGHVGGYVDGKEKKIELLEKEGVEVREGFIDLEKYFFRLK
jgi:methylated-DNA-[protein]-cysteine S-methyltransferase